MIRRPPAWALASSLAAPVFLVAGWWIAQSIRDDGFDSVRRTISALAAEHAPYRWIMTVGFVGLGVAHLVTALGLPLRALSRAILAVAGVAVLGVAAFPLGQGGSAAHGVWATLAFALLALWPATTAARRGPWAIRPATAVTATLVSTALVVIFAVADGGATAGAWERVAATEQALWPLLVIVSLRRGARMRA